MTNKEKALEMHKQWNGKLSVEAKCPVASAEDLAIAYTPGVAEPCRAIAENPKEAYTYTIKSNTVAVVSDGSAVLGLGNIGALAAMPVMEGKAALFKDFGGVNAFPICLDTQDTEEIIKSVVNIAPAFGEDDSRIGRNYELPFVQFVDGKGDLTAETFSLPLRSLNTATRTAGDAILR